MMWLKNIKRFFSSIYKIKFLLIALVVLSFADGLITYFVIKSGNGREGNPVLGDLAGDWKFLIIKLLGGLLCAFLLWDIHRKWPKLAMISTACLVTIMACIVLWNICSYFIGSCA